MEESILTSIKLMLGMTADYTPYDQQVLMCINTAMNALTQVGIGPVEGFTIRDASTTWEEWIGTDPRMEAAKSALFIRTKMLFDPPANGVMDEAYKEQLAEIEWRLKSTIDHPEV